MAGAAPSAVDAGPQPSSGRASAEIVDLGWLESRAEAWDRLAAEAAAPNPFYARRVLHAHAAHGLVGPELRVVAVQREGRLCALLPFRPGGAWVGFGRRAHCGWISPYVVTSTPLVARDGLAEHVEGLLDGLRPAGPLWLLPLFSPESEVGAALRAALAARGWHSAVLSGFGRAVFDARDAEAYEAGLGRRRRKDLARRRRRLAELGRLEVASALGGEDLSRAVETFLALEREGWKGAGGTALASRPETAAFLREAFRDDGGPVACRADVMSLDGRPIAISLAFVCGGTAYLFKTAYDERLRRLAPGVLLEDEIVRIRRETGFAERLNSASLPGGLLDSLYPHREPTGDLLIAADSGLSARAFAALVEQERRRRRAIDALKGLYRRIRAACQPTVASGRESVEAK